jgi:hypothetical protein
VLATTSSTAADLSVLKNVALQNSDLSGLTFQLLPGGDQVKNQVTLDVCAADFPSEALRTARYQQAAASGDNLAVNNENVMYKSPAAAAQALSEVRDAVANCPSDKFLPSNVAGVPPLRFQIEGIPDDQLGPVTTDHVALGGTAADQSGQTETQVQVFKRRGKVVVGVYGNDLPSIKPLLSVVAQRLASLTPAEAGE